MWRWVVFALLVVYSLWLIFAYEYHFIDNVNLAFHEAGHIFLTPFGETMHFLGGTIGQLVFPVAVMVHFWRQEKLFEVLIGGIWLAESLMYAAEYMADAKPQVLPLVGGGVHDWNFLFSKWGLLESSAFIAGLIHVLASLFLLACLGLMLVFLYQNARED